jgi:hypothetical protein
MALDPVIINRDDIPKRTRCKLSHGGSFLLSSLRLATTSSARFQAASPYLFVRKIPYVISTEEGSHSAIATEISSSRFARSGFVAGLNFAKGGE